MTALAQDKAVPSRHGRQFADPVAAAMTIYRGALVALDASGNAVPAGDSAAVTVRGVADAQADNAAGLAGAVSVSSSLGVYRMVNSAGADEITAADTGRVVYAVDDQTVARTSSGETRIRAGIVRHVESAGVWVDVGDAVLPTRTRRRGVALVDLHPAAALKDAMADAPNASTLGLADTGLLVVGTTTNSSGTASASETATAVIALPEDYAPGGALSVVLRARVSVAREVSATADLVAQPLADGVLAADICTTAAQALGTAYADLTFTLTPTGLAPGDVLHLTVTLATNDTGGGSDGAPALAALDIDYAARV